MLEAHAVEDGFLHTGHEAKTQVLGDFADLAQDDSDFAIWYKNQILDLTRSIGLDQDCGIAVGEPDDLVARLSGDEFVILMDHLDSPDRAIDLADRIRKAFTEPLMVGERIIFTSASIGIVPSLVGYKDPDEVLRDADTAMYAAKEAGRGRYRIFDQRMRHEVLAALELENDLWRAYAQQEFVAHYSPIHRLEDGQVVGSLTLVVFPIPTGIRGWIEDVVVESSASGKGIGTALNRYALALARDLGAKTVDLTSRPSREVANRLYRGLGFVPRETNVYRYDTTT